MRELITIIYMYVAFHLIYLISSKIDTEHFTEIQKSLILILIVFWPVTLILTLLSIIIFMALLSIRWIYCKIR